MTPTLKEAIEAKRQLETDILNLVRGYEQAYGVTVSDVELLKIQTMIGNSETVSVRVMVEV